MLIPTNSPIDTDQPTDPITGTIPDIMIVLPDGILATATIINRIIHFSFFYQNSLPI